MPVTNKVKTVVLTTTLTTALLTAGSAETIRVTHIIASCGTTAGSLTLSLNDNSGSVLARLWNAKAINANANLEIFDLFLESNDELRGGYTTASSAELTICYQVET
ncbi:MAG: hypothetical protein KME45_03365 [Stenomitos rutilans HA7619-LM2]|jgi:hypothetical protein|nr:hypothetical protein [Stenomitos rutilans HA7619-LM2]MBW4469424.1 hypothetical protein [Stenomitos rutilans HA7619-LM2]